MVWHYGAACMAAVVLALCWAASGQEYGPPDRGQPGDEMIQAYLRKQTEAIHGEFLRDVKPAEQWAKLRPRYRQEYLYMLGLADRSSTASWCDRLGASNEQPHYLENARPGPPLPRQTAVSYGRGGPTARGASPLSERRTEFSGGTG